MTLEEYLASGNLGYALEGGDGSPRPTKVLSAEPVALLAYSDVAGDGTDELAVLQLADGSFCLTSFWCDYTFSGGDVEFAWSLDTLCRMYMDEDQRHRLGFDVFGNKVK